MFEGEELPCRMDLLASRLGQTEVRLMNSQCTSTELSAELSTGGGGGLVDYNDMKRSNRSRPRGDRASNPLVTALF